MPSLARTFYREERSAGVVVGTQSIWGCRGQCPRRSRGAALASPDGRGGSPSGETERACIYLQNTVYFRFFTAFALSVKNRRFLPAPPVGEPSGVRWGNWDVAQFRIYHSKSITLNLSSYIYHSAFLIFCFEFPSYAGLALRPTAPLQKAKPPVFRRKPGTFRLSKKYNTGKKASPRGEAGKNRHFGTDF